MQGRDQLYPFASLTRTQNTGKHYSCSIYLLPATRSLCSVWGLGCRVGGTHSCHLPVRKEAVTPDKSFHPGLRGYQLLCCCYQILSETQCMGARASRPHTILFFQTWPSAWRGTSCLQQEANGDQPTGQDVGWERLPKGNSGPCGTRSSQV